MFVSSNGNANETKANESFDNGVFFDIKAKWTPSIMSKSNLRSEANWIILKLYKIEAKRTVSIVILYLKQQQKSKLFFLKRQPKNETFR
jgi:hypothetical protein